MTELQALQIAYTELSQLMPFKVVYRLYEYLFTSYGQMAQVRWKQGDFTDYRNYWPWNW